MNDMSKTWVVWVDLTHRIEVEAANMMGASDIPNETIWGETNMVNCIVKRELVEGNEKD